MTQSQAGTQKKLNAAYGRRACLWKQALPGEDFLLAGTLLFQLHFTKL